MWYNDRLMKRKRELMFRAVIFDMDGVITNTMLYHFDAWLKIFEDVGVKVDCFDIYKREGQDGLSSVKEILAERGVALSAAQARGILLRKERLFKRIVKIKFVKGARPFIRMLKKQGFLLGLVTGTSRHEVERIMPGPLLALFDASVTGDEIKKGKPYPEPFLKALAMLGVRAHEAVVIENAPFGIEAARRAQLFCIALQTSLPKSYLKKADLIYRSFEALKKGIRLHRA